MPPSEERTDSAAAYPITVDYGRSFSEMVTAGHYDFVAEEITAEHFPVGGSGTVQREAVLINLDHSASNEEVERETAGRGLRSATIEELLAFGEAYPDVQRSSPVVALDAVWVRSAKSRAYARLVSYDARDLNVWFQTHDWDPFYRFLTIRP